MMKQRWGLDRNVLRPTPGYPLGVEQHHWNTGAEENLPITCENFAILRLNSFNFTFFFFFLENVEKNHSQGVGQVTVNTTFFSRLMHEKKSA